MRQIYRYGDWFNRPRTVLVRGQDYTCSQSSMEAQIRNAATKACVRVRIVDSNDRIVIWVVQEHADAVTD